MQDKLNELGFKNSRLEIIGGYLEIYLDSDGKCWSASVCCGDSGAWYGCNHEIPLKKPQTVLELEHLVKMFEHD